MNSSLRLTLVAVSLFGMAGCCKGSSNATSALGMDGPGSGKTSSPMQTPTEVPAIPEGKSSPPSVAEWSDAPYVNTVGANSAPHGCFMKVVREWLKVNCSGNILSVSDMQGFGANGSNYFEWYKQGSVADYVIRLHRGGSQSLKIHRPGNRASLFVNWPQANDRPTIIALQNHAE